MRFRISVCAAAVFIAGAALAQTPPSGTQKPEAPLHTQPGQTRPAAPTKGQAPPAEPLDPAKEAAIRQLMDLTGSAKLGEQMMGLMMTQVRSVMSRTLPDERLKKFMDTFDQKLRARITGDDIVNAVVPIYARHFSLEDIQGLNQFYESPLGQRVVKTLPQIVQESQAAGAQIGEKAAFDSLREMTDEYPELKSVLPDESKPAQAPNPAPTPAPKPAPPQK